MICNEPEPAQGKGYQAHELGVPLISDTEFMEHLDSVIGGTDIEDFTDHTLDGGAVRPFLERGQSGRAVSRDVPGVKVTGSLPTPVIVGLPAYLRTPSRSTS